MVLPLMAPMSSELNQNKHKEREYNMLYKALNFDLGETNDLLLDQVRQFVNAEIAPIAEQTDKDNDFPHHLWKKFGDMGLLGMTVDEKYGGVNMGYVAHTLVAEEIARASASICLSYGAHSNLCVNQIHNNGSEYLKQKYLPPLVAGDKVGALAITEPNAGSDAVSISLRAEKQADKYLLNGSKTFITNGPDADIYVIYAKTEPELGPRGMTAFIVERGFAGFATGPKFDKLGMRGSNTGQLFFDNCEVPAENILGQLNGGAKVMMSGLDIERVVLGGIALGVMQACLDTVLPYIHERKQFGQSIGEFQFMQGKVADIYAKLNSSRAYLYTVAKACERGEVTRKDAAAAILLAAESSTQCALDTIQILGGNGYMNDLPAGRFLRDSKLLEIGGGTSEIRRMLIGRELFNESA